MTRQDFSHRSTETELMDTEATSFGEFFDCLRVLETINTLTLAYRPTLKWLEPLLADAPSEQATSILDVGCGGGDMLRQIWRQTKKQNPHLDLVGIDINPWSKQSTEKLTPKNAPIRFETVNLFDLDPADHTDFIISSLFTHHLSDPELILFLQWMDHRATRGWFINDLHRHPLPYYFIKYVVKFFSRNRLIQHDAPVSVARSFTAADWQSLLKEAGIPTGRTRVTWHFPFRYGVSCWKV